jgi:(1->4)-alpha-D-glucan 1-alpha-D-glucosylmutase
MKTPLSTYRLQITADCTLQQAAGLVDYLRELGADWVYLSPILQASAGSMHGYDVIDHSRVDADRGGEAGLVALSAAARDHGLGVLVDIVPNHVGVANLEENAWWWDVLQNGRSSRYADYFDIDWEAGDGRVLLPRLEAGAPDEMHDNYALVDWRRGDTDLNYRRFFAVSDLAAIRVELPQVFEDSHREIVRWVREGLVDGIRVDHPDGLADPGGYLDALAAATGGAYVLVEKILEGGEQLPPFWATAGTTGYDALADLDRVLVDPAGRARLDALDASLRGTAQPWGDLIHDTKLGIANGILQSEVRRLVRELPGDGVSIRPSAYSTDEMRDAMAELLACFPVYRSYLPFGAEHLDHAVAAARERRPDLTHVIDALHRVLADPTQPAAVRFQQTSGMVMAKGVEDTAFYRVSRLASLTEVGADPDEFAIDVAEFHARQQSRLATHPASMTTLSTHDTKRGEDTRARISVIAEVPDEWAAFIQRRRARHALDGASTSSGALENVLWESIVGSWPRDREALHAYAEKAAREAGTSTTWADPDESFEQRMHALVDAVFDDEEVAADVAAMVELLAAPGWSNGLAVKMLQLTAPGVPDVYQGSELWERSLVDPDNRRPIDYGERRLLLAAIDAGAHPPIDETGAAKLLVVSRALRARRDRPELFDRYVPLPAIGDAADHLVAVDRGGAIALATRLPVGLAGQGGWGDTVVLLPVGPWCDQLTGTKFDGGETRVTDLFAKYPVALLLVEPVETPAP